MSRSNTTNLEYSGLVKTPQIKSGKELAFSGDALQAVLRDVLNRGLPFRFKARGASMIPFIKDGDVLTIRPKGRTNFGKGDVVVYHHRLLNRIVIHRIIGVKNGCYMLKGDNTTGSSDFACKEDILGRVSEIERNGRETHLGLGPGRVLISLLTRLDWLFPVMLPLRKIIRPMLKRILF